MNHLLLSQSRFQSPVWATFNQVRTNGGKVNKGNKATFVVFWKRLELQEKDPKTGTVNTDYKFLLRYYNVFNTDQCDFDNLGQKKVNDLANVSKNITNERNKPADQIIRDYPNPPKILTGNYNPCYVPSLDEVRMPELANFASREAYYDAKFHELIHSTGHKSRLDRDLSGIFGIDKTQYSKEELTAEIGSAFLCSIAGIDVDMENVTAYVKSWLKVLQDNPSWIVSAAGKAQKACEHIIPSLSDQILPDVFAA